MTVKMEQQKYGVGPHEWLPVVVVVYVVSVVPIIPATMCNDIVEVRVGVDNSGILAHGSAHVKWSGTRDPAPDKCETRLLVLFFSELCRYGSEPCGYWM